MGGRCRVLALSAVVCSVIWLGASGSASESIYELIMEGKLQAARDSLSDHSTASTRDGNSLYFQSLLETDAHQSARMKEAALKASVSPRYQQEIYFDLANYYFIVGQWGRLSTIVNEYRTQFENGRYSAPLARFSAVVDERGGALESAVRQIDRYLLQYDEGHLEQLGLVDKARLMMTHGKQIAAGKLLQRLARQKSGAGVAQALYLLALEAINRRDADETVLYYNLLRDGYPSAVGLDALAERMASMSEPGAADHAAEALTGTYYSVQVGVFSSKDNAQRQARLFAKYDKEVDVTVKSISNVEYHVVYVGRFRDYYSALSFKEGLQKAHGEVFQVVAR